MDTSGENADSGYTHFLFFAIHMTGKIFFFTPLCMLALQSSISLTDDRLPAVELPPVGTYQLKSASNASSLNGIETTGLTAVSLSIETAARNVREFPSAK